VLAESPSKIEVRVSDGKVLALSADGLLDVVRERDDEPEERALLEARVAVLAGGDLDAARKTLDRLLERAESEWVREYALAARALLAERAGEKDALDRIERFLKEHAGSRWTSRLYLARGRLKAHRDSDMAVDHFAEAHAEIGRVNGPLLLRLQVFVEDMRTHLELDLDFYEDHLKMVHGGIVQSTQGRDDAVAYMLATATLAWVNLAIQEDRRERMQAAGEKPLAPLAMVKRLRDGASLQIPELRSDLQRELGLTLLACGEKEQARIELEKALELAPGPIRKQLARRALEDLPR
jgi:tetratricopeptide (TPR) repeat protein